ncbi:MAG: hypothetical protein WC455_23515 [Dehalococcoidia bacterium]|jgi:hypothetical protein
MMERQKFSPKVFPKYRVKIKGDAGEYDVWGIDMLNYRIMVYRATAYEWIDYRRIAQIWTV